MFGVTIILSKKVMMIEIKQNQLNRYYLKKVRSCLNDIINNLKKSGTWKIQLTTADNFISSSDHDEERVMHSKSDNEITEIIEIIEIMINVKADEVIKERFNSLKNRYQNNLESKL